MKRITVLLVEDNPADVCLAEEMIQDTGLNVEIIVAEDGQQALDFFEDKSEKPDLVLLDLKLPKVGGLEVLRFIREEDGSETKVVILTGSLLHEDRKTADELGVDTYLIKPNSLVQLEQTTFVLKEIMSSL